MITVILRYDDFSARSDSTLEARLIALFTQYRVPCVFGVVPFVCAGDERSDGAQPHCELPGKKVALLREGIASGVIEPALHGYHHQNCNPEEGGRLREFAGLPFEEQLRRLQSGKEWLERAGGAAVETFIPPFNAYDRQTLAALEAAGFSILSAAMFDEAGQGAPLTLVPHTCNLLQVRDAIARVRQLPGTGCTIVPLFHPFDFAESEPGNGRINLDYFGTLLAWLKEQQDVELTSFSALSASGFDAHRYIFNRSYLRLALHPLALPWWQKHYPRTQYLPVTLAKLYLTKMRFSSSLFFLGFLGAFLVVGMILARAGTAAPVRAASLTVLLTALLLCVARGRTIYFRTYAILLALSGIAVGAWLE